MGRFSSSRHHTLSVCAFLGRTRTCLQGRQLLPVPLLIRKTGTDSSGYARRGRKAFWFPLDKAHRKLTYRGEREVLKMAQKIVREHPERLTPPVKTQVASGPAVPRPVAQQRSPSQRNWQRNVPPQRLNAQQHPPQQRQANPTQCGEEKRPSAERAPSGDGRRPTRF